MPLEKTAGASGRRCAVLSLFFLMLNPLISKRSRRIPARTRKIFVTA
jgi:hypothetical protein